jgi:hypothetical protein
MRLQWKQNLKRTEKQAWAFEKVCSLKLHFIHPKIKQKRCWVEFSNLNTSCFPKGIGLVLILTSCAFPGLEKQPVAL